MRLYSYACRTHLFIGPIAREVSQLERDALRTFEKTVPHASRCWVRGCQNDVHAVCLVDLERAQSYHEQVRDFHRACGLVVADSPRILPAEAYARRVRLMAEEFAELTRAHAAGDLVEFADGVADLVWVTLGTGVEAGLPMDDVWAEVSRANMAKAGGTLDGSGKLRKPAGWTPPDVAGVLARAGVLR